MLASLRKCLAPKNVIRSLVFLSLLSACAHKPTPKNTSKTKVAPAAAGVAAASVDTAATTAATYAQSNPKTNQPVSPAASLQRFSLKKSRSNYVLDSEVMMSFKNVRGRPVIQVDLPHSRGCLVSLDEEYPGYSYPEHIANSTEKIDPVVFVLKYDSRCLIDKRQAYGEQTLNVPMTSQIDLYSQITDAKLPLFKKDFESGSLKISICRFWECSEIISYKDSLSPTIFFRSEYQPPQQIDLKLAEEKKIRADVPLVEAIYGPPISVCDGRIKQVPTLNFALFLPSLSRKAAVNHQSFETDDRYIFRFYKGEIISKMKSEELAKNGEVFCSLRIIEQKPIPEKKAKKKVKPPESFEFAPIQAVAYASNLGATFYSEADKEMSPTQYFSRTFELYGSVTQQNLTISGGFCSTPHGDSPTGRQALVGDIIEHIPGVSLTTNYPAFYSEEKAKTP